MKNQYLKRVCHNLQQDQVVTIVSILGTALSIFLIMIVVLMKGVQILPFSPESNRNRILHGDCISYTNADNHDDSQNLSCGILSEPTAKALYTSLKTPEAVSIFQSSPDQTLISSYGTVPLSADLKQTDDSFWRIFDFNFLSGKAYNKSDFNSAQKKAVISEQIARRLFGNINVVGRNITINHSPYHICGVVREVSNLAESAYSQIWIPYSTTNIASDTWGAHELGGSFSVAILAYNKKDFPKIKAEFNTRSAAFNAKLKTENIKIIDQENPHTQFEKSITPYSNGKPERGRFYRQGAFILFILLLIPAINLSSMTQSRLHRYMTEIGIRRAFGCHRSQILNDIIIENLILSTIAGFVGLLLCLLFAYFGSDFIFTKNWIEDMGHPTISLSVLLNPILFLLAFLFCFVLNLISSIIPAWQASHVQIINAINGKTH